MLTIAICDDEPGQLQEIHVAAERFVKSHGDSDVRIRDFSRAIDFLDALDEDGPPDIALLDVCMPGFSGVQVARAIRAKKLGTKIIFLTASKDYAIDAFEVDAVHYLTKPFTQEKFDGAMGRVAGLFRTEPKCISVSNANGTTVVDITEISHIESQGYRRYVHTVRGKLTETHRTLSQFAEELETLSPGKFITPYRGYIVNLSAVRTLTSRSIEMKDGSRILIKSGDYRKIKEQWFTYMFQKE